VADAGAFSDSAASAKLSSRLPPGSPLPAPFRAAGGAAAAAVPHLSLLGGGGGAAGAANADVASVEAPGSGAAWARAPPELRHLPSQPSGLSLAAPGLTQAERVVWGAAAALARTRQLETDRATGDPDKEDAETAGSPVAALPTEAMRPREAPAPALQGPVPSPSAAAGALARHAASRVASSSSLKSLVREGPGPGGAATSCAPGEDLLASESYREGYQEAQREMDAARAATHAAAAAANPVAPQPHGSSGSSGGSAESASADVASRPAAPPLLNPKRAALLAVAEAARERAAARDRAREDVRARAEAEARLNTLSSSAQRVGVNAAMARSGAATNPLPAFSTAAVHTAAAAAAAAAGAVASVNSGWADVRIPQRQQSASDAPAPPPEPPVRTSPGNALEARRLELRARVEAAAARAAAAAESPVSASSAGGGLTRVGSASWADKPSSRPLAPVGSVQSRSRSVSYGAVSMAREQGALYADSDDE